MSRKEILLKSALKTTSRRKRSGAIAMVNKGGKTLVVKKTSPEPCLVLVTT